MVHYNRLVLYFDGASKGNPRGPAGCGWVIYEMNDQGADSRSIARDKDYLGYNISNNQAEYRGLINGLDYMARQDMTCNSLYVRGDSKLVIRQMEGKYQVKSNNIKPYYNEAQESLERLDCARTSFKFVPRERNCVADELANEAIQNG